MRKTAQVLLFELEIRCSIRLSYGRIYTGKVSTPEHLSVFSRLTSTVNCCNSKTVETWQRIRPNLIRHRSVGHYARAYANGKGIWQPLKLRTRPGSTLKTVSLHETRSVKSPTFTVESCLPQGSYSASLGWPGGRTDGTRTTLSVF